MQDCIFLLFYGRGTDAEDSVLRYLSYHEVRVWAKDDGTATLLNQLGWGIIWHHLSIHSSKQVETMNYLQTYRVITRIRRIVITYLVYPNNMSICPSSLNNKVQIIDGVTVCITWYCYSCFRQPYISWYSSLTWTYDVHKCPQDFSFTFWIRTWRFRVMWLHPPWRIRERLPETQVADVADV